MSWLVIMVLRFYGLVISPLKLRPSCRFYPSCSLYAIQAIQKHGLLKGGRLAALRVMRCHPFNPGGYDPVP
ncbi:MAG TPA: membrane protein insertion efficiency factor YidD [Firmicutes bacterium]|nr:membrane protein insertion efficiency factor YidD [Bacillota bacterium]HHY97382.1 membrane protein insertion efficiency factor YidD [Bacillota bacterium]